jgi:hypothetical protein
MPKKDDPLKKRIFLHLIRQLTLNQQGYEEKKRKKNVLSRWKDSYAAGLCPFSQERTFFPGKKVGLKRWDLMILA